MGQILLLSAGFVVLVVISAASVVLVNKSREDNAWVVHTIEVENQTNALLLEIRRAESAARGYLVTMGPEFLADHNQAVTAILPDLEKLERLTADNPLQVENIKKLRAAIETQLDQFTRELKFIKQGSPARATALVREAAARDTTSAIRDLASAMRIEEERLFNLRVANADRSERLATIVTIAGSALVFLLAGIAILLLRQSARGRDEAEARLRDANLNLEATVDERTADLREANNEVQRFAHIVSHDLRSPLVNIMGFTSELEELRGDIFRRIAALRHSAMASPPPAIAVDGEPALEGADLQLSQDFSEALGFIKSSIAKMDRLITAILSLTREGRRQFDPVKIDTGELIETVVAMQEGDQKSVLFLYEFVKLRLYDASGEYSAKSVRAVIAPNLVAPVILGLPFLSHNSIVINHATRTVIDKFQCFDLMHPTVRPPPPVPKKKLCDFFNETMKYRKIERLWSLN